MSILLWVGRSDGAGSSGWQGGQLKSGALAKTTGYMDLTAMFTQDLLTDGKPNPVPRLLWSIQKGKKMRLQIGFSDSWSVVAYLDRRMLIRSTQ